MSYYGQPNYPNSVIVADTDNFLSATRIGSLEYVSVSDLSFSYISRLTSNVQNQLDNLANNVGNVYSAEKLAIANVIVAAPVTGSFDGADPTNGQVCLLTGQNAQQENGMYTFNGLGVPMTRVDILFWTDLVGSQILVAASTTYPSGSIWRSVSGSTGTIDNSAISFVEVPNGAYIGSGTVAINGNTLSVPATAPMVVQSLSMGTGANLASFNLSALSALRAVYVPDADSTLVIPSTQATNQQFLTGFSNLGVAQYANVNDATLTGLDLTNIEDVAETGSILAAISKLAARSQRAVQVKSADYAMDVTDQSVFFSTSGATATLPVYADYTAEIGIIVRVGTMIDVLSATVFAGAGATIDGPGTYGYPLTANGEVVDFQLLPGAIWKPI